LVEPAAKTTGQGATDQEISLAPGMAQISMKADLHLRARSESTLLIRIEGQNLEKIHRLALRSGLCGPSLSRVKGRHGRPIRFTAELHRIDIGGGLPSTNLYPPVLGLAHTPLALAREGRFHRAQSFIHGRPGGNARPARESQACGTGSPHL